MFKSNNKFPLGKYELFEFCLQTAPLELDGAVPEHCTWSPLDRRALGLWPEQQ